MEVIDLNNMNIILEIKKILVEHLKLINKSLSSTDQDIYFIILFLSKGFNLEVSISYKEIQIYSTHSDKTIERSLNILVLYGLITKRRNPTEDIKVKGINSNYLMVHNLAKIRSI